MRLSLAILLFTLFHSDTEIGQRIFPVLLKENLKLNSFDISKSYRLNDGEFILIGKNKKQTLDTEGHRLLYLSADSLKERFTIKYLSKPKGEAYVYNPYFFELKDELIIVAEEGYEYMSGIDIYRLKNKKVDFLGYVPVSGDERNSIADKMKIEKETDDYTILFEGRIEYKAGTDNLIDGKTLKVSIDKNGLKISTH
ncbi:hypothetical protein [Chryseolinea sp. H1M3-3]|uniref:hypothetical protein n=1 Tax=Chryseolinea sp. H1M3-3 TaxID=3034144 RepID=UPI0023EE1EE4|nr:hypothetical protein [Chryseolinea sp. H1M3-3]